MSSHNSLILPVSGSIARARMKSLTVNLIAFSGATPCHCLNVRSAFSSLLGTGYRTHDELRSETAVEPKEALVPEDLLHTVKAVLVQQLSDNGASLVLHSVHVLSCDVDTRSEYVPHRVYRAHAACGTSDLCLVTQNSIYHTLTARPHIRISSRHREQCDKLTKINRIHDGSAECPSHACALKST